MGAQEVTTESSPAGSHNSRDTQKRAAAGRGLEDALLLIYSDALDDLEDVRKRTANRIDALRRVKGLTGSPEEARLVAMLAGFLDMEKAATKQLESAVKQHRLGPWILAQKGVGLKQAGRLLGTIGDPYWHSRDDRPRTVSELWALCGYHVIPAHMRTDSQGGHGGDDPFDSHPGQFQNDAHGRFAGVAARRTKGQKANWNSKARSRAWCIAESIVKAGIRTDKESGERRAITPLGQVYLDARDKAGKAVHQIQCQNHKRPPAKGDGCGTQANPEWGAPGTPLRDGHVHARAMRAVAKEVLKGLWLESKRLHEADALPDLAMKKPDPIDPAPGRDPLAATHGPPDAQDHNGGGDLSTNAAARGRIARAGCLNPNNAP